MSYTTTLHTDYGYFESNQSVRTTIEWDTNNLPLQVEIPVTYIDSGFIFGGFADSSGVLYYNESGNLIEGFSTLPNILYATELEVEEETWYLTLDANEGLFSNGTSSIVYAYSIGSSGSVSVEVPTRDGYKFTGFYDDSGYMWYDENGMHYDYPYSTMTLYAHWVSESSDKPWDNVDENAPACQAYIDDTGSMYARNFRIHSADTIVIDDLGDVYAKSFTIGNIVGMSADGLIMKDFNLIR